LHKAPKSVWYCNKFQISLVIFPWNLVLLPSFTWNMTCGEFNFTVISILPKKYWSHELMDYFYYHYQMAFMMCCAFMLTWTPYAVVSFWAAYGEENSIPLRVTLVSVLIAKTSTIWNPLIYFILNKKFKPHIRLCLRTIFRYDLNAQQRSQRSPWQFCHCRSSTSSSI
jgi:hypothetical protein